MFYHLVSPVYHSPPPPLLIHLTGKDVPFVWNDGCQAVFEGLRDTLISAPVLAFPTEDGQYFLETDVSDFRFTVLSQLHNGMAYAISYFTQAITVGMSEKHNNHMMMLSMRVND